MTKMSFFSCTTRLQFTSQIHIGLCDIEADRRIFMKMVTHIISLPFAIALAACGGGSAVTGGVVSSVSPPGTITGLAATAADGSTSITFAAPASNGGTAITGYTANCIAASVNVIGTGTTSPIVVSGLTNGTSYSCSVIARNSAGSGAASSSVSVTPFATGLSHFKGQVWADNWFSLSVGENKVAEDSVPITTERSFNSETFFFDAAYPFDLNYTIKDFIQNDTGLEYIGLPNQQIGDGGFIMQITDMSSGKIVAVSGTTMKCLVIHKAPLNPSCEKDSNPSLTCLSKIDAEPVNWKSSGYDVSAWQNASVYTEGQIGVKEGYYDIVWNAAAKLIWTADLKADNTLLCKSTVRSN
jgi:hypothetical protein